MADHWWWRPGWRPGRRMYTWHFTFADQPAVQDLSAGYQASLAGLPGLDLVPARWLHLTTQGIGFTDEVTDADLAAIIAASRRRLVDVSPARVTVGPARLTPEALLLDVTPSGALTAIRAGLRAAIGDVWPGRIPETDAWTPHVSVAYSNTDEPAAPYAAALAGCAGTADVTLGSVQAIVLGRDHHVYEWDTRDTITLPSGWEHPAPEPTR
jgi:2'-5' RNA ligase